MNKKILSIISLSLITTALMPQLSFAKTTSQSNKFVTTFEAKKQLLDLYNSLPTWPNWPQKAPYGIGIGLKFLLGGSSNQNLAASPATSVFLFGKQQQNIKLTANQLARWLVGWAAQARNVPIGAWESSDAFTLLKTWGFWNGTAIKKSTDYVASSDFLRLETDMRRAFGQIDTISLKNTVTMQYALEYLYQAEKKIPIWPHGLAMYTNQGAIWRTPQDKLPQANWYGLVNALGLPKQTFVTSNIYATQLPTTALMIADWIVNFEVNARKMDLRYEPSQDPFTLIKDFGLFQGTNISQPKQTLTSSDFNTIIKNFSAATFGIQRKNKNTVDFHAIMMDKQYHVAMWNGLSKIDASLKNAWPNVYQKLIELINSATLTFHKNGVITYNRKNIKGYGLGIAISYMDANSHVYSQLYRAIGKNAYTISPNSFNEKLPFVFSPKSNLTSKTGQRIKFLHPKADYYVEVNFAPYNYASWVTIGEATIDKEPSFGIEFNKSTGDIIAMYRLTGPIAPDYPAEVVNNA